ncbi:hypothetical protein ACEN8I_16370 [Polaromonas sp. CT11-55]|uniref:hypothetical protein n=1 Tax=Polaromonas sp. CT11-55 TaxID=3243045 RepID=UPI0039A5AC08
MANQIPKFKSRCKRALRFLSVAIFICANSAAQQTLPVPNQQDKKMEVKKQQVLGFLGRLKIALDLNVIDDPRRLQEVTGFEVLEWSTMLKDPHYRAASRWRFNVVAMDQAPEMLSVTNEYRTGYSPADKSSYPGGMSVGGFPAVACITPADMDQIFGVARLDAQLRARPHRDQPWVAPFWDVNAYIFSPINGSLLTLSYHYDDESKPKATCLAQLGIGYGLKPPAGY